MTSLAVLATQQIGALPQDTKKAFGEGSPLLDRTNSTESLAQIEKAKEVPVTSAPASSEFNFSYDRDINHVIVKILSEQEVVKQIPPEQIVKMYKALGKLQKTGELTDIEG